MTEVEQLYDLIKQHHGALTIACRAIAQSFSAMADLCVAIGATQNDPAPESEPESSTIPTEVRPPEMGVHKPSTVPPARRVVSVVSASEPQRDDDGWELTGVYVDGKLIAQGPSGYVEPEDATFGRDYGWVLSAFEGIACQLGAVVEYEDIDSDDLPNEWPPKRAELPPTEGNEIAAVVAATDPVELPPIRMCDKDCPLVDNHDGPCLDAEDAAVVNPDETRAIPLVDVLSQPLPTKSTTRSKTDMTASQWANGPHFLAYVKRTEPFLAWSAEEQNAKRDAFVAAHPGPELMNRWGPRFRKFCGVSSG